MRNHITLRKHLLQSYTHSVAINGRMSWIDLQWCRCTDLPTYQKVWSVTISNDLELGLTILIDALESVQLALSESESQSSSDTSTPTQF